MNTTRKIASEYFKKDGIHGHEKETRVLSEGPAIVLLPLVEIMHVYVSTGRSSIRYACIQRPFLVDHLFDMLVKCSSTLFCELRVFGHSDTQGSNLHQFIFLNILDAVVQTVI